MLEKYQSNGKLLVSGEYVVLDGATALSLPTRFGQSLAVNSRTDGRIRWESLDCNNSLWFQADLFLKNGKIVLEDPTLVSDKTWKATANRLVEIFNIAHSQNPKRLSEASGFDFNSKLDFPLNWGLGTSSTLVNNIADFFKIDAFKLLESTFGGSGYDVASAQYPYPISFCKTPQGNQVLKANFYPNFKANLFFVYLNRKQNSRESIATYKNQSQDKLQEDIERISGLTRQLISCESLLEFELLLEIHENLISNLIGQPKIKTRLFPDFQGALKSLGGWGGDFILATGGEQEKKYFRSKGYTEILDYSEMILE